MGNTILIVALVAEVLLHILKILFHKGSLLLHIFIIIINQKEKHFVKKLLKYFLNIFVK